MGLKEISIEPITRLEGHGKITIFLDEEGDVKNAYFQFPELRGFERFCEGRQPELMPDITSRICGVCPVAHHMASTKALDDLFGLEPTSVARKIRELMYYAFYIADHSTIFYVLSAPDFVVGPQAPPAERNIVGLLRRVGAETGRYILQQRINAYKIMAIIGCKKGHPTFGIPGGVGKPLTEEERAKIEQLAKEAVEFGKFTVKLFKDVVVGNPEYLNLVKSETYYLKTYYMGLVDGKGQLNIYDGNIRVVTPSGKFFAEFPVHEYLNHIAEHVEPWSYMKFPYLKKIGWKGFVDGEDCGIYRVGPLARFNVADGIPTSEAHTAYEEMFDTLGGKPVHYTLAYHWARVIEILYAAEKMLELAQDPEITNPDVRRTADKPAREEGIGVVEAPRGVLIHHYWTDKNALLRKVNLIVATVNNNAAMNMSIRKAAKSTIRKGKVSEGLLNMVEMAFRAYDPCIACGTHVLGEKSRIPVEIYDRGGRLIRKL
ncbi:MAG: Ni/Fe hydrogenase subunit alpha [Candidatus Hecatellaceae archaeon]